MTQEQIDLAVEVLEPFAARWESVEHTAGAAMIYPEFRKAYDALIALKAIQPTGEARELIADIKRRRQRYNDSYTDEGIFLDRLADALERQSPTPQPQQDAGSGGWKLVPVEPTEAMLKASWFQDWLNEGASEKEVEALFQERWADERDDIMRSYRAMLAAAPQPEPSEPEGGER